MGEVAQRAVWFCPGRKVDQEERETTRVINSDESIRMFGLPSSASLERFGLGKKIAFRLPPV